jgi:uncharacterized protein (TIGR03067 family)
VRLGFGWPRGNTLPSGDPQPAAGKNGRGQQAPNADQAGMACFVVLGAVAAAEEPFDAAKLVGTWNYVSGEKIAADRLKSQSVTITKQAITLQGEAGTFVIKYELHAKKTPVQLKMTITDGPVGQGTSAEAIIELKGDDLKFCYALPDQPAPKAFEAKAGSNQHLFLLKRAK